MSKNDLIIQLFEKAGIVGPQPNLLKLLKDMFLKTTWNEFIESFKSALMSVFISETSLHSVFVNNIIKFAANGVSMLIELMTCDGRTGLYLMSEVFRLCRLYGRCSNKTIRWRFCLFLNNLLNCMADETTLSVEMCEIATLFLLERLKDKKFEVRVQAAYALNRLQLPNDPNCPIVKKFIFHMTCDSNIEVRTAIVKKIAMFNNVIEEMLKNTVLDISDNVRKEMYNRFLKYPFLSLSSKQRQTVLEFGLNDDNPNITSLVKKRLILRWLEQCNDDFIMFLEHIGVENESICEKTLYTIFESYYDSQILDLINKYLNCDSRMIDYDILTVENIFLWKCVAKYLTTEKKIELARNQGHFDDYYIDVLLPDLVKFSDYIRSYYFTYDSKKDKEFIMTQLLNVARTFSIDDVGASSLNKLCFDLILDNELSIRPIEPISVLFDVTFKHGRDILKFVKQALNEIQARTIDVVPIIDKIGKKQILKHHILLVTKKIEELNQDPDELKILKGKLNKMNKEYIEIIVLPQDEISVNKAVKYLHKGFELIFQVQQLPKVIVELSLLTDIIQNIVIGYLKCPMVELRMEAIRSLSPYLLANNVTSAKKHIVTLCNEISNPLTNRNLIFNIMFELFLRYDLKAFNIENYDLDTDEVYEDGVFSVHNVLSLLVNTIDYTVNDNSFKSTVVKGFCQLMIFNKVKSINLLSKLLIIWNRRISYDTFNIYNYVVRFITSYSFFIRSSSSTFAKCYVPVLREIEEHDLIQKLDIKLKEVNSILLNLTLGIMYHNEKKAINSHGELATYILDYLLDENQSYTSMLVETLCKLELNFNNNELVNTLHPKLTRVIKYLKNSDDKKSSNRYLKKIKNKFNLVLERKKAYVKRKNKKELLVMEVENEISVTSSCTQESNPIVEVHGDLFSENPVILIESSDEDDDKDFAKLDAIKRMSEIFKKSFKDKSINN